MKAVVSTTYDNTYLFFLPIITWCWNKLGVDVICFMPLWGTKEQVKNMIVLNAMKDMNFSIRYFKCPIHKEATYAQCSRLYAAALDLPEDEVLITSDIDMAVFINLFPFQYDKISVTGIDLVPQGQIPMCYISGPVKEWRRLFEIKAKNYQECLDDLLGSIEAEHFRGNYWAKDQETAYEKLVTAEPQIIEIPRARQGTQFAMNRVDRDDINWRSYCGSDLIDAHLWRSGYEENNFNNILELLQTQYPSDNFNWLINYRNEYIKLL